MKPFVVLISAGLLFAFAVACGGSKQAQSQPQPTTPTQVVAQPTTPSQPFQEAPAVAVAAKPQPAAPTCRKSEMGTEKSHILETMDVVFFLRVEQVCVTRTIFAVQNKAPEQAAGLFVVVTLKVGTAGQRAPTTFRWSNVKLRDPGDRRATALNELKSALRISEDVNINWYGHDGILTFKPMADPAELVATFEVIGPREDLVLVVTMYSFSAEIPLGKLPEPIGSINFNPPGKPAVAK